MGAGDEEEVSRLTGRFYTVIPHSFGRARPPLLDTLDKVKGKLEMCDVLSDIETAQARPGPALPPSPSSLLSCEPHVPLQECLLHEQRTTLLSAPPARMCEITHLVCLNRSVTADVEHDELKIDQGKCGRNIHGHKRLRGAQSNTLCQPPNPQLPNAPDAPSHSARLADHW